jgi:hypothetical protein
LCFLRHSGCEPVVPRGFSKSDLRLRGGRVTGGHTYGLAHDPVVYGEKVRFQKNREDGETKVTTRVGRPLELVLLWAC